MFVGRVRRRYPKREGGSPRKAKDCGGGERFTRVSGTVTGCTFFKHDLSLWCPDGHAVLGASRDSVTQVAFERMTAGPGRSRPVPDVLAQATYPDLCPSASTPDTAQEGGVTGKDSQGLQREEKARDRKRRVGERTVNCII